MGLLEALKEKPVKIEAVYMGEEKEGNWEFDKWNVTLSKGKNSFATEFKMGLGLRKDIKKTVWNERLKSYTYKGLPVKPKAVEVMYPLLMEAGVIELTFDEFCREYGYDEDSRKAKKIYNACIEQTIRFKRFLGEDFNFFMENNEY